MKAFNDLLTLECLPVDRRAATLFDRAPDFRHQRADAEPGCARAAAPNRVSSIDLFALVWFNRSHSTLSFGFE